MFWSPIAPASAASPSHGAKPKSRPDGAGAGSASGSGVELAQPAERVDAGLVPIAPVDLDAVAPDRRDAQRAHVLRYARGIETPLAAPLVDAGRAAAGEPELADRKDALASVAPGDRERARALLADVRRGEARLLDVGHRRPSVARARGAPSGCYAAPRVGEGAPWTRTRSRSWAGRATRGSGSRCASRARGARSRSGRAGSSAPSRRPRRCGPASPAARPWWASRTATPRSARRS